MIVASRQKFISEILTRLSYDVLIDKTLSDDYELILDKLIESLCKKCSLTKPDQSTFTQDILDAAESELLQLEAAVDEQKRTLKSIRHSNRFDSIFDCKFFIPTFTSHFSYFVIKSNSFLYLLIKRCRTNQ